MNHLSDSWISYQVIHESFTGWFIIIYWVIHLSGDTWIIWWIHLLMIPELFIRWFMNHSQGDSWILQVIHESITRWLMNLQRWFMNHHWVDSSYTVCIWWFINPSVICLQCCFAFKHQYLSPCSAEYLLNDESKLLGKFYETKGIYLTYITCRVDIREASLFLKQGGGIHGQPCRVWYWQKFPDYCHSGTTRIIQTNIKMHDLDYSGFLCQHHTCGCPDNIYC